MKSTTVQQFQHFVGKICSIITTAMNRSFSEQVAREHFVVRVESISPDGIWGSHPYNPQLVSFFAMPHVISIHQELELNPEIPEHAELIKQLEKTGSDTSGDLKVKSPEMPKPKSILPVIQQPKQLPVPDESETGNATFVDIKSLELLAEKSRRVFQAQDAMELGLQ